MYLYCVCNFRSTQSHVSVTPNIFFLPASVGDWQCTSSLSLFSTSGLNGNKKQLHLRPSSRIILLQMLIVLRWYQVKRKISCGSDSAKYSISNDSLFYRQDTGIPLSAYSSTPQHDRWRKDLLALFLLLSYWIKTKLLSTGLLLCGWYGPVILSTRKRYFC